MTALQIAGPFLFDTPLQMMQIELLLIGKIKESHILAGTRYYGDKLQHYCKLTVTELGVKDARSHPSEIIAAESVILRSRLKEGHTRILLDQRGQSLDSPGLAHKLQHWELHGTPRLQFLVGGAYGVSDEIREGADWIWSLSDLTFPHPMVRLILLEQLYRAFTIRNHIPYHHG
jgi:23S rRNA (pseudouridine1915-N3)-methyltransferase